MQNQVFMKISSVIVTLGIGVGVGGGAAFYHFRDSQLHIQALESARQELKLANTELEAQKLHLEFVADMATQFSVPPNIVDIVHEESVAAVDPTKPEWRLIQTSEFMTYLMLSIIHAESKGDPLAVGDSGKARGLTQIWVTTAQQYGVVTARELHEPATNLRYAFAHFSYLLQRYQGNLALTLYAWNRGEGTVDKLLSYGEVPVNGYGVKIYRAALSATSRGD